jgi:D-glycero-D-manno-heptose 1,7-bisphosphate phosphatase
LRYPKHGNQELQRAVFLDRDGVINSVIFREGKPASPRLLSEFQFEYGIERPLERLKMAGLRLFVITNQPDIARGLIDRQTLNIINQQVMSRLSVEAIEVCPHDDRDDCRCRKPRPGMLIAIADRMGIELTESFVVGDSWRDVQAARAAGCAAIILDRSYNRNDDADFRVTTLGEAAQLILGASSS